MMQITLLKKKSPESAPLAMLSLLAEELAVVYTEEAARLKVPGLLSPEQHEALLFSLRIMRDIRERVRELQTASLSVDEIVSALGELSWSTASMVAVCARSPWSVCTCTALSRIIFLVSRAESHLVPLASVSSGCERVLLQSSMLYLYHYSLFPPERMLVVAGSLNAAKNTLALHAAFDVTPDGEEQSPVHVKADPKKLRLALAAMDSSATRLGCWVHSHPGRGIKATWPSEIDRVQHEDWITNFHRGLLSVIMVEDGYFRCFGEAIEKKHITLCLHGKGIEQEEDNVYRLTDIH